MKLIFIYGPPAAGKYTVGKELSLATGFKFFHNHLTVPAVDSILPEDTQERIDLLSRVRSMVITKAAEKGIDIIFTVAYSGAVDDDWVDIVVKNVKKYGGEVCFVQLFAPKEELLKRVGNESRRQLKLFNKPTSKKNLSERLKVRDHYASVKYDHLLLDTTRLSPDQSARKIIRHFSLKA